MYRSIFLVSLVLNVITCLAQDTKKRQDEDTSWHEHSISIDSLIATPERYHGKKIQIAGYLNLEFEGNAIYLHKEDREKGLIENGFWVSFSDKLNKKEIQALNKSYVLIEGKFDMNSHGHRGMFGGEIKNIKRIIKWH